MRNISINFKYLCQEHHTGKNGVHHNIKKDLEYKKELQTKLEKLFAQSYYTTKDIKNILEISDDEAKGIVKTLSLGKEGYVKEDIIRRCMGGRTY